MPVEAIAMQTMTRPAPPEPLSGPDAPHPLRWTREEFYRLAEAGFFRSRRVMLIEGEVVCMSPQNEPHARAISMATHAIEDAFGRGVYARVQMPLDLLPASDPEPDVAIVTGSPRTNISRPKTALLVVEVADSSLAFDTGDKGSLYAAAGIADYWVVDLAHNRLLVYRDPRPDPSAAHGASYFHHIFLGPTDTIAPLAAPGRVIAVADLLP